jgi:polygalacturonase
MVFKAGIIAAALVAFAMGSPAPMVTPAPRADAGAVKRAGSCTFSGSAGAAAASKSQASCATIVLSNVAVPSGTTLDLSNLKDDTTVIFEGETTWGYKEWDGPLLQIKGTGIDIKGASGAVLNANGAKWWDGEGSNGGKTKPKFFYVRLVPSSHIVYLIVYANPDMTIGS